MIKNAVIISFLGKTKDRFSEYNEDKTTAERLAMASEMEGIEGIEAVFPYLVNDPQYIKPLMSKYNLEWAAVNVNVKAEPEFTLVGGILRFETFGREVQKQLDKDVNVPDAEMVQYVCALGAAVLGQLRIDRLNAEAA